MRKDKKQVIGDEIGDEQIKLFLDFEPVDATSPSLHKLIKAYR
ncbi:PA4642 family protein, partial [Pseudomonas protegens]